MIDTFPKKCTYIIDAFVKLFTYIVDVDAFTKKCIDTLLLALVEFKTKETLIKINLHNICTYMVNRILN